MSKVRKLKIHSKHRIRTWDQITVPEIRLTGQWLNQLGFEEGQQVLIEQKQHKLVLTVSKTEKN